MYKEMIDCKVFSFRTQCENNSSILYLSCHLSPKYEFISLFKTALFYRFKIKFENLPECVEG